MSKYVKVNYYGKITGKCCRYRKTVWQPVWNKRGAGQNSAVSGRQICRHADSWKKAVCKPRPRHRRQPGQSAHHRGLAGKNNFLKQPEFSNIEKVKEILTKFDEIESINDIDEEENGIKIHIGKDSELSEDVSVIKTKYNYNGEEGTIAIIGPKRMEYERVVNLLNYIKENIDDKDI